MSVALATAAAVLASGLLAGGAGAAEDDESAVLTGLASQVLSPPSPVIGTDGRMHLVYEMRLVNTTRQDARIDRVQPRAAGKPFGDALQGDDLAGLLNVYSPDAPENTIPAGGAALLFMDVTYSPKTRNPERLEHGFNVTLIDPETSETSPNNFIGVPTRVLRREAVEVEPPLTGDRWVVANGCCNPINAHRGATLGIDGTTFVSQRYAIDFVQLNEDDRLLDGPLEDISSYNYFGAKNRSATDGKVVRVRDGEPEQVPGSLPEGQTVQTADGNYVVVKFGKDQYAFYAHNQPGSIRVEVGDKVKTGQVLGLLGNTGNTDGPHLHFHVMDGPSPLKSNGVPYVFTKFDSRGVITNYPELQTQDFVAQVDSGSRSGQFKDALPQGGDLIDFGK